MSNASMYTTKATQTLPLLPTFEHTFAMEGKQNIDLGELHVVYNPDDANLVLASFNLKHHNDLLWSINYKYDYMPKYKPSLPFLIDLSSFPDLEAEKISVESIINILPTPTEYPIKTSEALSINSLPISPTDAKLPWHSSIHHVRQNIHWQTVVEASKVLLYNISSDQNATSIPNYLRKRYADIAAKELPSLQDGWIRFSAYMWPAASRNRLKILTEMNAYSFIFDCKRNHAMNVLLF